MRTYIRHPVNIPVQVECKSCGSNRQRISNLSNGGLAFETACFIEPGTQIRLSIDIVQPCFKADGIVSYCRNKGSQYRVGVEFIRRDDLYIARMVEQICHIESYKQQVAEQEGRMLSPQEAAREWISKYASRFPHWGS